MGDTDNLDKALGRGGQSTRKFGKAAEDADKKAGKFRTGLAGLAKAGGVGLVAGVGAGAVAVKGFVKAASDSEASTARMRTQLKALGISFDANAKHIDKVIQKTSALSGLDDEDLQDSFTNIVRTTGDVNKALKLNAVAADLARAKHLDVAKAGDIVAKVAGGNTGILGRYGITIKKGATSTEALGLLQKKFAGQAKAYGDTSAGAQEKFKVAVENLQEAIGQHLLPVVTKIAQAVTNFVLQLQTGTGAGGTFRNVIASITGAVQAAIGWLQQHKTLLTDIGIVVGVATAAFTAYKVAQIASAVATGAMAAATGALNAVLLANPITLVVVGLTALGAGLVLAYKHSETFRNIVNAAWGAVKTMAGVLWSAIKVAFEGIKTAVVTTWNVIRTVTTTVWGAIRAVLTTAWGAIKTVATTYFNGYRAVIVGVWNAVRTATVTIWNGLRDFLGGVWGGIKSAANTAWQAFKDLIVNPVTSAVDTVKDALGNGKKGLITWLGERVADIKKAAEDLAAPFVTAFHKMRDAVKEVMKWVGKVKRAVDDVVGAIGKIKLPKIKIPDLNPIGSPRPGAEQQAAAVHGGSGGTFRYANQVARLFGLHVSGGWRSVQHNAAVGGVPNSLHTHGSPSNPGAIDMVGPVPSMYAAANWARANLPVQEVLVHDVGSGLHLHLGFFKKGGFARGLGVVGEAGPELVDFGSRGAQVYSNRDSRAMLSGGSAPVVNIHGDLVIDSQLDESSFLHRLAFTVATATA